MGSCTNRIRPSAQGSRHHPRCARTGLVFLSKLDLLAQDVLSIRERANLVIVEGHLRIPAWS